MQRADRARAQGARREEKLRQRQERSDERKAAAATANAQQPDGEAPAAADSPGKPRET
jgi:hypothetical protein